MGVEKARCRGGGGSSLAIACAAMAVWRLVVRGDAVVDEVDDEWDDDGMMMNFMRSMCGCGCGKATSVQHVRGIRTPSERLVGRLAALEEM